MYKLLFYTAILVGLCTSCTSSAYNEEEEAKETENQQKRDWVVGKWVRPMQGQFHGYYIYRFRADGTGAEGRCYDDPNVVIPNNPDYDTFRYDIYNDELVWCYYLNHTHPLRPGEKCGYSSNYVHSDKFSVNETFLIFAHTPPTTYTRVSKWSDVGLPDDLLPE